MSVAVVVGGLTESAKLQLIFHGEIGFLFIFFFLEAS